MDTRFSSAIHMLILIYEADGRMTSEQIASSVGTNASYIRKISGPLKREGIIACSQGMRGFSLLVEPEELSLYRIYEAFSAGTQVHFFDQHRNTNCSCCVGRQIGPVLDTLFNEIEESAMRELKRRTLFDCIEKIRFDKRMN